MNPFVLARAELFTPWDAERVLAAIDTLLREGFDVGDAHYRLFGGRLGRAFSMSLGLPFIGGGAPVLRGRLREGTSAATLDITVGGRHEAVVFCWFWILLTAVGGSYQLWLQVQRVLAGAAGWGAVAEVLPGIGIMAGIVTLGLGLWRHRAVPQAHALIEQLRLTLEASYPSTALHSSRPTPIT